MPDICVAAEMEKNIPGREGAVLEPAECAPSLHGDRVKVVRNILTVTRTLVLIFGARLKEEAGHTCEGPTVLLIYSPPPPHPIPKLLKCAERGHLNS
jgi:hypothetical protein